jgi:hypothetical protein
MSDDFDLSSADAQDEAVLAIKHPTTDEVTTWVWTFYGPGHPKTIEVADRASKAALNDLHDQKQARINNKKYKIKEQSLDDLRVENIAAIVSRLKTFTPVKMGAETVTFTPEAAAGMLLDRRKGWLYEQVVNFLKEDANFIQPSAKI